MANGEKTRAALAGGLNFAVDAIGAVQKRAQSVAAARAQNNMNRRSDFNRAHLMAIQDDEMVRLHDYKVDAYNRFIPRAFDRANLAYQDNNAVLKELIDQYQFQGQDRLAASVAQQGAMAAAGRTGRGAMTSQVALDSNMGRGDALMANNLLRARFGTQRANQRIRQQLVDTMQNAYNQVGFTPKRTQPGMFQRTPKVNPAYGKRAMWMDIGVAALNAVATGLGGSAAQRNVGPDPYPQSGSAAPGPMQGQTWGTPPPLPPIPQFSTQSVDGTFRSNNIPGVNTANYKLPNL